MVPSSDFGDFFSPSVSESRARFRFLCDRVRTGMKSVRHTYFGACPPPTFDLGRIFFDESEKIFFFQNQFREGVPFFLWPTVGTQLLRTIHSTRLSMSDRTCSSSQGGAERGIKRKMSGTSRDEQASCFDSPICPKRIRRDRSPPSAPRKGRRPPLKVQGPPECPPAPRKKNTNLDFSSELHECDKAFIRKLDF